MSESEQISRARRRATEQIDSAFTAINEGQLDVAASWYVKALEDIGRAKMFKEKLGAQIADAPPTAVITVDGKKMPARQARLMVAVHYLKEHNLECPIEITDNLDEKSITSIGSGKLKPAIVSLKSLSAFL